MTNQFDHKAEESLSRRSFLAVSAATASTLTLDSFLTAQAGETSVPGTSNHHTFIRRSIALAEQAKKKGNFPFGAVLVHNGNVLMEAENTAVTDGDPTRHAELNLVSAACRKFTPEEIASSVLYASTEPCAMCAGGIYWGNMHTLVYGCSESSLQKLVPPGSHNGNLSMPCRNILAGRGIKVIGPILEEEALAVHKGFWEKAHISGM
jgi:tRNA(Arg) A34 adenosine deaminase TadA